MSYFPVFAVPTRNVISTFSPEAVGMNISSALGAAPASAAFPATNRAIYIPFQLRQTIVVTKLFTANGGTAGNNFDIGIFDHTGVKIVSSGSTAQSGTTTIQVVDITDTPIGPGKFFLAHSASGTTGRYYRWNAAVTDLQSMGVYTQETAFALPTTATFATPASGYLHLIGLATVTTV